MRQVPASLETVFAFYANIHRHISKYKPYVVNKSFQIGCCSQSSIGMPLERRRASIFLSVRHILSLLELPKCFEKWNRLTSSTIRHQCVVARKISDRNCNRSRQETNIGDVSKSRGKLLQKLEVYSIRWRVWAWLQLYMPVIWCHDSEYRRLLTLMKDIQEMT